MTRNRLEAFSDGVIAIIITIMVLELRAPHDAHISTLRPLLPVFFSYAMSFIFIGIYWSNHHHLFHAVEHVNGRVLWANLHLLFWLSLTPFVTAWIGESGFASWPVALYGAVLLLSGVGYYILTVSLLAIHSRDSVLAKALGRDFKGKVSMLIYLVAIPLAFVKPWLAYAIYVCGGDVAGAGSSNRKDCRALGLITKGRQARHVCRTQVENEYKPRNKYAPTDALVEDLGSSHSLFRGGLLPAAISDDRLAGHSPPLNDRIINGFANYSSLHSSLQNTQADNAALGCL